MDLDRFEDLKDRYHAKRLVIAGDTDSLAALPDIAELGLPVFTVDTGLHLLAGMGLRAESETYHELMFAASPATPYPR